MIKQYLVKWFKPLFKESNNNTASRGVYQTPEEYYSSRLSEARALLASGYATEEDVERLSELVALSREGCL